MIVDFKTETWHKPVQGMDRGAEYTKIFNADRYVQDDVSADGCSSAGLGPGDGCQPAARGVFCAWRAGYFLWTSDGTLKSDINSLN
jgi:hypothetical protein